MIWIASFPRSGNTFLRNIFYEVYGLKSSTYHLESSYPIDDNYDSYPLVKTHLLPSQLTKGNNKSIYLVRDGRDALISVAHMRKDIVAPESNFRENLKEAIIAAEGSYFGGWSENVKQWFNYADVVIKYEELIINPKACFAKISKVMNLPAANWDKLPTFEHLKNSIPKYGAKHDLQISDTDKQDFAQKFFRKGKANNWIEEMPDDLHDLFWYYHGKMMDKLGYSDGRIAGIRFPKKEHWYLNNGVRGFYFRGKRKLAKILGFRKK